MARRRLDQEVEQPLAASRCGRRPLWSRYRVTLPALRQEAQTFRRFGLPATVARTRWMLGSQRRLVFFFDQGTLWPKPGLFPQTSQTAATGVHSRSMEDTFSPRRATELAYRTLVAAQT